MTVTMCDHCGMVCEENRKLKIGGRTTRGTVIVPVNPIYSSGELAAEYDLCETCMKELVEFLNDGKEGGMK